MTIIQFFEIKPLIRRACTGLILATIGFSNHASADEASETTSAPSGIQQLRGHWSAPCDAWGTPAQCDLIWGAGLHPNHLTVKYTISSENDSSMIFSGQGVYRINELGLDGYWSASNGAIHPLKASWKSEGLTTHWGQSSTEQGRSTYQLVGENELLVTDSVLTKDGWREFMQVQYQRVE
jgi:hypothetical protein